MMTSPNTAPAKHTATAKEQELLLARGLPQIQKLYAELFDDKPATTPEGSTTTSSTSGVLIEDRVGNDDFYPKFSKNEVVLGKLLGTGGFATVYEIKAFALKDEGSAPPSPTKSTKTHLQHNTQMDEEQVDDQYEQSTALFLEQNDTRRFQQVARKFLSQHCYRVRDSNNDPSKKKKPKQDARYACKLLQLSSGSTSSAATPTSSTGETPAKTKDWAQKYLQGILDIAVEVRFLTALHHRNIVKVKAMACGDLFRHDYFIVLDRLYHTLEHRIYKVWTPKSQRHASLVGKLLTDRKGKQRDALWEERLIYAWDLSTALAYLHANKIVYRDLKPENIGFDCRNDVKLFDFGLSRPLKDHLLVQNDNGTATTSTELLYRLTAHTGSPRYMAPEVALGQPYNLTCDVYSFCILLWEMLALTRPFEVYTMTKMKQRVWTAGGEQKRPFLQSEWALPVRLLLQKGWTANVAARLTMSQVVDILEKECLRITEKEEGFVFQRRESDTSLVFQKQRGRRPSAKDLEPTAHEMFKDYLDASERDNCSGGNDDDAAAEGEDRAPSPVASVVSDEDMDSSRVGHEESNLPDQLQEEADADWWLGGTNATLEQVVREALSELSFENGNAPRN